MDDFYQLLQVEPTASSAEIEAAFERQYNYWRRLVTHHQQEKAAQASENLRLLENARQVLLDPSQRNAYDARRGVVGGLEDPSKRSSHPVANMPPGSAPTPPAPRPVPGAAASPSSPSHERVDVWTCPHCRAINPPSSQFCKACGKQIGLPCANCGKMIEYAANFCAHCGAHVPTATRKKELNTALQQLSADLKGWQAHNPDQGQTRRKAELRKTAATAMTWFGVAALVFVLTLPLAVSWVGRSFSEQSFTRLGWLAAGLVGWSILAMIGQRTYVYNALRASLTGILMAGIMIGERWLRPDSQSILGVHTIAASLLFLFNLILLSDSGRQVAALKPASGRKQLILLLRWCCAILVLAPQLTAFYLYGIRQLEFPSFPQITEMLQVLNIYSPLGYILLAILFGGIGLVAIRLISAEDTSLRSAQMKKDQAVEQIQSEIDRLNQELAFLQTK